MAPHFADRHEQARIVGRLEQVLEAPRPLVARRLIGARWIESEAQPEGVFGRPVNRELGPRANLAPQIARGIVGQLDERLLASERGEPGADRGRHVGWLARFGVRIARDTVDHRRQVVGQRVVGRGARRRGGPRQCDRSRGHGAFDRVQIGAVGWVIDDRRPAADEVPVARLQARQKTLASEQ
jgi:hypothetical protein